MLKVNVNKRKNWLKKKEHRANNSTDVGQLKNVFVYTEKGNKKYYWWDVMLRLSNKIKLKDWSDYRKF